MIARAMALLSFVADDEAPLDRLPQPWAARARRRREELLALDRGRRAAAIARESVECFRAPAPCGAHRPVPRGLALALAGREPAVEPEVPSWVEEALAALERLGVLCLARAASASGPPAVAELARRLPPDQVPLLMEARRAPVDAATLDRSRRLVDLAAADPRPGGLPRRVGLWRIACALALDTAARAGTLGRLAPHEAEVLEDASAILAFLDAPDAPAEQDLVAADLGRAH